MEINIDKINTMRITDKEKKHSINIEGNLQKHLKRWNYLRTIINEEGIIKGRMKRLLEERKTWKAYTTLKSIYWWKEESAKENGNKDL